MTNEEAINLFCFSDWIQCLKMPKADLERIVEAMSIVGKICINQSVYIDLEQVKQERDEAVQCIKGITKSGRVWMCPYCVHAKETTGGIAECELDVGMCMMPYSKFEWRGQKEE